MSSSSAAGARARRSWSTGRTSSRPHDQGARRGASPALGVLDRVLATGVPEIRERVVAIGSSTVRRSIAHDEPAHIGPRRSALDQVLLQAAGDAGAEVRTGTVLGSLLFGGGRVTGVRLTDRAGRATDVHARLVAGADGRGSMVARAVAARTDRDDGDRSIAYWSYWSGVGQRSVILELGQGMAAGLFPTNDGLSLAFVQAPIGDAPRYRSDPLRHYLEAIRRTSIVGGVLDGSGVRREGRMLAMLSLPNYVRAARGPGWALAGDAGHHKDPLAARGISDAFRDADLLAEARLRGLGGVDDDLATSWRGIRRSVTRRTRPSMRPT